MSKKDELYPDHKLWKDGTRQELIADPGEGLQDAIDFMASNLKLFGHRDLTFFKNEIQVNSNKFYITLRSVNPRKNHLFAKSTVDKVLN